MSEWYFMSGGQQQGPVTAAQLKALAAAGTVGPEDLVWNQSMTEWVPARRVRGLPFATGAAKPTAAASRASAAPTAVAEPPPEPHDNSPAETYQSRQAADRPVSRASRASENSDTADEEHASTEAAEVLGQTRAWVTLMALLTFVGLGLLIAFEVRTLLPQVKGAAKSTLIARAQTLWGMQQLFICLSALLLLLPWLSMLRLSSALGRAKSSGTSDDITRALRAQKSFWRSLASVILLLIVVGAGAYVYKVVLKK